MGRYFIILRKYCKFRGRGGEGRGGVGLHGYIFLLQFASVTASSTIHGISAPFIPFLFLPTALCTSVLFV